MAVAHVQSFDWLEVYFRFKTMDFKRYSPIIETMSLSVFCLEFYPRYRVNRGLDFFRRFPHPAEHSRYALHQEAFVMRVTWRVWYSRLCAPPPRYPGTDRVTLVRLRNEASRLVNSFLRGYYLFSLPQPGENRESLSRPKNSIENAPFDARPCFPPQSLR